MKSILPYTLFCFFVAKSCNVVNCETCSSTSEEICINCEFDYTRDEENGCIYTADNRTAIENCISQVSSACFTCESGYYIFNDRCDPICPDGCSCFYPNQCIVPASCDYFCDSCCSDSTLGCCACSYGYGLNLSDPGTCSPCGENCDKCYEDISLCTSCKTSFYLDRNNLGQCELCSNNLCNTCEEYSDNCTSCKDLYGINNGNCELCADTNCSQCGEDYLTCNACKDYYGVSNGACALCADPYCLDCSTNYEICTTCIESAYLNQNSCIAFLTDCGQTQCKYCYEVDLCYMCIDKYYIYDGFCYLNTDCIENCQECYSMFSCYLCISRYTYNSYSSQCEQCPSHCLSCYENNGEILCDSCESGYTISDSYKCKSSDGSDESNSVGNKRAFGSLGYLGLIIGILVIFVCFGCP